MTMATGNNSRIRKRGFWYVAAMLLLIGIAWLSQYSQTGAITVFSGAAVGIIIVKIQRMTVGYVYDHPLWFRLLLIFTAIITIFGGMIVCRELSKLVYTATEKNVSPVIMFLSMSLLMTALLIFSYRQKKGKEEQSSRIYSFLIVFAVCMVIAQCCGSMLHSSSLNYEQWKQENAFTYGKEDIVGSWVITNGKEDILGVKSTVEVFNADGSWQSGSENAISCKGRWILNGDIIEVRQTWISVGSTHRPTDNIMTYTICSLTIDSMVCQRGEYTIVFHRVMK